ncbi:hypothetical protein IVA80_06240 [Bradyrhizobium sp. 139]|uniref:hypothetical protein n=1 Tax=Bradyrhizobium sp. 139 TaxID=2782616 RepID=UPI001FF7E566|nr:hypothetical protein [Bradyrhizobium sp. 139]MCK1740474.1 hypothetical protein [Bradyrhizobium sp. 139]
MTAFAQAPEKETQTLRWLPFIAAIAAVTTATPFAWDKSLGTFLFLISLYLPAVALVCVGLCIWAGVERKSSRARSIVVSLVVMLTLIGGTFGALPRAKDELRFLAWSYAHNDALRGFADKDSVMLAWESWGMAGMENDAYLVSNPSDNGGGRWSFGVAPPRRIKLRNRCFETDASWNLCHHNVQLSAAIRNMQV